LTAALSWLLTSRRRDGDEDKVRQPMNDVALVVAPTITKLPDCDGAVLLTGSHGGAYCGTLAIAARVRAAIFHDAGIGLDEAAIALLAMLDRFGIAAAAVSHETARIGDTSDMLARGRLSRVNGAAAALGLYGGLARRLSG
jgi:hypothetical protein